MNFISDFIELFYPKLCAICGEHLPSIKQPICFSCEMNLPYTHENPSRNYMANHLRALQPIDGVFSLLYQTPKSTTHQLLHQLKYKNRKDIGYYLGQLIGRELNQKLTINYDCIIPVPLHPAKQQKRGFNQSNCIAKGLSEELNIPVLKGAIVRTINTSTQTKKNRDQRFKNMENVFQTNQAELHQQKIILVDDVLTTGATTINCAKTLFTANVQAVFVASASKADFF